MLYTAINKYVFGILFLILLPSLALGASHYIRDGATGSTCADWGDNACDALPVTLVRGDTYYIADGNYAGYDFDTANSGTNYIYIKKATVADHGTDTGWQDSYGDGQAVWTSMVTLRTSYWQFDGNTGTVGQYGFRVYLDGNVNQYGIVLPNSPRTNITIKDTDVDMSDSTFCVTGGDQKAIKGYQTSYSTLTNVKARNYGDAISIDGSAGNMVYEYLYLERTASQGGNCDTDHGDALVLTQTTEITIRYSKFNWNGQMIWHGGAGTNYSSNLYIYGNLFYTTGSPGASCASVKNNDVVNIDNLYFYNNTVYNVYYPLQLRDTVTGVASNNIFISSTSAPVFSSVTHDYNASDRNLGEGNGQTVNASIFTSASTFDLTLANPTVAGDGTIGATYNTDMLGNTRGADGTWDRGAYEYTGVDSTGPVIFSVLPNSQQVCTGPPLSVQRTWQTNEAANCRIHATSSTWAEMAAAETTGGTSHSDTASQACGASYTPYIICQDASNNESSPSQMNYSIAAAAATKQLIGTGGNKKIIRGGSSYKVILGQ